MAFCFGLSSSFAQQEVSIKGVVKDAKTDEPLIGVSILLEGTSIGAVTDIDGAFSLLVPSKNSKLKVSYIGYEQQIVTVGNQTFLNIKLSEDSQIIDEVVVVGYGTQKKESVIGSIASMNNETIKSLPVSNITQALAGKLSGVQVVQSSGEVGRDEADVFVRGLATYGDARPIVVIDGIIRESYAHLDPNEIQSINVLKDASATAVYGIKGANGVIIITTRRGTVSDKPQISFSAQLAITQPIRIPQPLGSYQAAILNNMQKFANSTTGDYTALDILKYRTHSSLYTHPDTDWTDEVLKDNSTLQQYNLNISGGNNFVKYFVSGGYLTQDGFYKHDNNTNFSRYNFRSNLDFNVTKDFTIALNLGARVEKRAYPGGSFYNSWNIYRGAFATGGRRTYTYNPDGSLNASSDEANLIGIIRDKGVYRESKSVLELGVNLKYDLSSLLKGLTLRGQVAYDNSGSNAKAWEKRFVAYQYNLENDTYDRKGEDTFLSYWSNGDEYQSKVYLEGGLEYSNTFGLHSVGGLFLANRTSESIKKYVGFASQGLVGRATYDYDKRYFAEVNIGYNGSENFSKKQRYGFFPAFALGWILSNEKFITNLPFSNAISNIKLRSSIGWVGNDRLGDMSKEENQIYRFMYIQSYLNNSGPVFGIGNTPFGGIYQESIANEASTWEVGRKFNLGLETSFFRDKLGFNVEVFQEKRTDILTDITAIQPGYLGAKFKPANVGIVENKGIEFEFSHRGNIGKDFNYHLKANYSFTRNKIIQKADPAGMLPYQKEEGYSIGVQSMYKVIGVFQDYADIYASPNQMTIPGNVEVKPGDLKYLDFNNDGKIDINDAFRQGYGTVPEIQYGITLSADYKGFDMTVLFQGSAHSQFAKNWEIMWPFSNSDNAFESHWNYWTPETAGSEDFIRIYGPYQNNEPGPNGSSYSRGSGDYVRLKNLEIGYTFPRKWTSKLFMSSLRLYFAGNNLILWADEPYLDPDNRDQRGGVMPQTRAFNFGVNINF